MARKATSTNGNGPAEMSETKNKTEASLIRRIIKDGVPMGKVFVMFFKKDGARVQVQVPNASFDKAGMATIQAAARGALLQGCVPA